MMRGGGIPPGAPLLSSVPGQMVSRVSARAFFGMTDGRYGSRVRRISKKRCHCRPSGERSPTSCQRPCSSTRMV